MNDIDWDKKLFLNPHTHTHTHTKSKTNLFRTLRPKSQPPEQLGKCQVKY